jgi:hypothetical protein
MLIAAPCYAQVEPADIVAAVAFVQSQPRMEPAKGTKPAPSRQASLAEGQAAGFYIPASRSRWTHPGNTKAALINHLLTHPNHRKVSRGQLEQLSYAQLERLHSADHEGLLVSSRLETRSVVTTTTRSASSYCPSGNCPRPTRFRLFRR